MADAGDTGAVASAMSALLRDDTARETQDLHRCGHATVPLLLVALGELSTLPATSPPRRIVSTLFSLAEEHISSTPFASVARCWLQLYTDASIVGAILDLMTAQRPDVTIRRLDMAQIVAGAIGEQRREWIQRLIRVAQRLSPPRSSRCTAKRRRLSPPDPALLFAPTPIPTLPSAPSLSSYIKLHKDRPFILREYATSGLSSPSWPAIHRWRSPDYLLDTVGEGRVVPVEIGAAYDQEGWGQRIVPLRDMMARAGYDVAPETPGADSGAPLYLAQHSLLEQFPELGGDICMPDYVWSNPAPDRAPATDDGIIINVWLGSASSEVISPAHTDPYYNCYVQVLGSKRVWLAPPEVGKYMLPHGSNADSLASYMTNTSQVPILRPINDFQQLRPAYPDFFEHVWPVCLEAVLEPGDLLIMPPGWWHAMRAEGGGVSWSVSIWY
ncbi:hypothetical protein EHS25_010085 [Saitozyma podzolica]|uniref:JmjC domain-containing protein n=1 Tax=Saitozyma podzolica TaxID=1890683 RepID=A0A427YIL0_9TREE|nr:hypothetical protein EHS25_010085 [Saitozyma podzolica]